MRTPRQFRAAAALALSVQLAVAVLGTVGMCVDRPHTHGGKPAPDCPMHHQQPSDAAQPSHHHHHESDAPAPSGASIGCSCAADALLLLLAAAAVVVEPSGLDAPNLAIAPAPALVQRAADLRVP